MLGMSGPSGDTARHLSGVGASKIMFVPLDVICFLWYPLYYIAYAILILLSVPYLVAGSVGFLVSVINAYYWNNKYVFRTEDSEKRVWWKVFVKTFIAYAGTGLVLNNLLLIFWINLCGIPEMIGPIINLFVTIPINFVLNKFWTFGKEKE